MISSLLYLTKELFCIFLLNLYFYFKYKIIFEFKRYENRDGRVYVVAADVQTADVSVFSDCPLGMRPNLDNFCVNCLAGFYGINCEVCVFSLFFLFFNFFINDYFFIYE
jgi:hypothetical protein